MSRLNAEQIAQRAFNLGLVDDRQLQDLWSRLGSRHVDNDDFLQMALRTEMLTNYQVERLVNGEKTGFFFGNYKVLYLVGAGSFARVYRAMHRETGQIVALKVLRERFSSEPAQYKLFVREGKLGCTLRHENIVPIYEVYSKKKTHFLVMEFVEGRTLREFLKVRNKIEPAEAVKLMTDITAGMQYAHAQKGLLHRDLKVSNVLVASNGTAKLVDFGLAGFDESLADDVSADAGTCRTIDYAALERATTARRDDPRSDIYFLGCIFYHIVTGKSALLETKDRVQRLSKQRFLDVVPPQQVDETLPATITMIVNKAMSLDPDRRYQTPGAMLTDLRMAARRLADPNSEDNNPRRIAEGNSGISSEVPKHSVMVVESRPEIQDLFRSAFKKAGFRVLVMSNSERAVTRLMQDPHAADCVLFNAQELGAAALKSFNKLGEDEMTARLPVVLLLDEPQKKWKQHAKTSGHRVLIPMPVTMKQLRGVISQLIGVED